MKIKLVLLLFILPLFCKAQTENDHLEPIDSFWELFDYQFDYYPKVRKVLYEGLTEKPEVRFLVMPSFTPENVLDIQKEEGGKYFLVYHIGEKRIWNNEKWDSVKVKEYKVEIDREPVELVKKLFLKAIFQTKYKEKYDRGFDGVDYYFFAWHYGLKSGQIWIPSETEKPKMSKLVEIGNDLIELAKTGKEKVSFDKALIEKIKRLMVELEE